MSNNTFPPLYFMQRKESFEIIQRVYANKSFGKVLLDHFHFL